MAYKININRLDVRFYICELSWNLSWRSAMSLVYVLSRFTKSIHMNNRLQSYITLRITFLLRFLFHKHILIIKTINDVLWRRFMKLSELENQWGHKVIFEKRKLMFLLKQNSCLRNSVSSTNIRQRLTFSISVTTVNGGAKNFTVEHGSRFFVLFLCFQEIDYMLVALEEAIIHWYLESTL